MTLREELLKFSTSDPHTADICGRAADELLIKEMRIEQQEREINHLSADKLAAAEKLAEACAEFVRKVDCGEAKSVRSYLQMTAALAVWEASK